MKSRALLVRLVIYGVLLVLALKFRDRMQQLPRTAPSQTTPLEVTIESSVPPAPPGDRPAVPVATP